MEYLLACLPWVVFAVYLGLMVRRGNVRLGRAVALYVGVFVGAWLLKLGAVQIGILLSKGMFPPGHFPQGPHPLAFLPMAFFWPPCIDVPLLLVMGVWLSRNPLLTPEAGAMSRHDGTRDGARP